MVEIWSALASDLILSVTGVVFTGHGSVAVCADGQWSVSSCVLTCM